MGCGCGNKGLMARRPVRNTVKSAVDGVLRAVTNNTPPESQAITEERRKKEKLRRDAILRALGRP